ncbi:hypothetical protein [Flavobacterium restrictum]|nr:hypothetical protein [Flavobacterium restrictum]
MKPSALAVMEMASFYSKKTNFYEPKRATKEAPFWVYKNVFWE